MPAYVVGSQVAAPVIDEVDGAGVIYYVEPVTDVFPFPIDRDGFIIPDVMYGQWDQLFRELVGSVII